MFPTYPDEIMRELGLPVPSSGIGQFELYTEIERGLPLSALVRLTNTVLQGTGPGNWALVSIATLSRLRAKPKGKMSPRLSAKVVRLARIWICTIQVWTEPAAAQKFLFSPHMLLRGKRPIDVASSNEIGAELVINILGRLRNGAAV